MIGRFGFAELWNDNDFYHIRYGRGAIIVTVAKERNLKNGSKVNSDKYVAQLFASRAQSLNSGERPDLDPVEAIEEFEGIVKIRIRFDRRYDGRPSYRPVNAVIQRVLPADQVTLEIVIDNMSTI